MIVFSAIVPHSPLLVPSIGKEHRETLAATLAAYAEVEEAVYAARPDTLLVISPHGPMYAKAFAANVSHAYTGTLKEFGDHGTRISARADLLLLDHVNRGMRHAGIPFTRTSQEELDYGYTVPLLLLTQHLPRTFLVPLSPSLLPASDHFYFGETLQHTLQELSTRVAIIASADLAHIPPDDSASADLARSVNEDIRKCIQKNDAQALLALDAPGLEITRPCGYKPILMLMGALNNMHVHSRELAFESPFRVGCVTSVFDLG